MDKDRRMVIAGLAAVAGTSMLPRSARGQSGYQNDPNTYSPEEILGAGHRFFGSISEGLARSVEYLFQNQGRPNGYIVGEEGGGAIVAGLRYGEGMLNTKNAGQHRLYWQGPSLGWDFGGDGARTMMLIYNLQSIDSIYRRYPGVNGSAYLVAGAGVSIYSNGSTQVAPIRSGVGARLGVNVGYLKFTRGATWNPF